MFCLVKMYVCVLYVRGLDIKFGPPLAIHGANVYMQRIRYYNRWLVSMFELTLFTFICC